MSEQILLLNPRRKRRRKGRKGLPAGLRRWMAIHRRHATNPRRRHRRHARKANRARRIRYMPVLTNRRRRARRSYRVHRRYARNPRRHGGMRFSGLGMIKQYVMPAVIGGVGTLALDVVYGYVSPYLPANLQAGWFGVLTKLGVILGAGYAVGRFAPRLRHQAQVATLGATTVLAYGAIKQAVATMMPAGTTIPGLSGFGAYQDFQRLPVRAGMGAYMPRPAGMGAYMPPRQLGDYYSPAAVIGAGPAQAFNGLGGNAGLAGFDYMNDGM